jgi:ribonuclease J
MQITIHRGSHEIGGNCIEVATENSRIILDVGMPLFDSDREPYDTARFRKKSKDELIQAGILPKIPGLFSDGERVTAILLSHAHEDHTGLLRHSHSEIPIFASRGTSKMMDAGFRFAAQPLLPRNRFRALQPQVPMEVGDFKVTPFAVDHSIFGSMAFLIEAEGKSILYSGDLRTHGRKPGMHSTLIQSLADRKLDVLLMEGTHIGHPDYRGVNEFELEDQILQHITEASGLVLASFSPQHVDRLVGFLRATRKANRVFVADAYTAYIMHLLRSETRIPPPESTDWIKVFFPKFFEESYRRKRLVKFHFRMSPAGIRVEEIRLQPSKYVMLFRPSMLESDFGGLLPNGSRCLYSRWTGYLDRPDWQPVKEALCLAEGDLIEVHTSGHIYADDIIALVRELNPTTVIPIHTFEPELFQHVLTNIRILQDRKSHEVM